MRPCAPSQISVLPLGRRSAPLMYELKKDMGGLPSYVHSISLVSGLTSMMRDVAPFRTWAPLSKIMTLPESSSVALCWWPSSSSPHSQVTSPVSRDTRMTLLVLRKLTKKSPDLVTFSELACVHSRRPSRGQMTWRSMDSFSHMRHSAAVSPSPSTCRIVSPSISTGSSEVRLPPRTRADKSAGISSQHRYSVSPVSARWKSWCSQGSSRSHTFTPSQSSSTMDEPPPPSPCVFSKSAGARVLPSRWPLGSSFT